MANDVKVPPNLVHEVQDGKVVLFLGSGASFGAAHPKGAQPPLGAALGVMLSDRFLGGKFQSASLSQIAEYAINESTLIDVQTYIKEIFEPFEPSPAHLLLPRFVWKGLATTNYDMLVEKAYDATSARLQTVQPFIENGDRVSEKMHDSKNLMFLKLHGCITRIQNPRCPLILTTDQYINYRKNRDRIFNHLFDWGYEQSVVFIGHSLQDQDIRAIIAELIEKDENRPRYYLVAPNKDDIESRFWESKKVTTISASFNDFINALDEALSGTFRGLAMVTTSQQHAIAEKFSAANVNLSRNCLQFLDNDVDYVKAIKNTATIEPSLFYKGYSGGWAPIEQGLDIRRTLGDTLLTDYFLVDEGTHSSELEVILVKAHAGAGKSVLLKRMAWDAARDYNKLCLYLRPDGLINTAAIEEIAQACKERIYLFVDNLGDHIKELKALARAATAARLKVTVVAAERLNEWNVVGVSVGSLITEDYELEYLNANETSRLIDVLATHKSLGKLEELSPEEREKAFHQAAGRQLLVALHEATYGKPFEDIVKDEYDKLVPVEAQKLYLSICILNRLKVPVRAGIISRLHNIPFREFKQKFFKPLEHVVRTVEDRVTRDMMYVARHPVIAEIVFDRVLRDQDERFEQYYRVLKTLNIDFTSDKIAFRGMTRGRTIIELFPNELLAKEIYITAHKVSADDAILFHQQALYEMHRNYFSRASELLTRAIRLEPMNPSFQHTKSELLIRQSDRARTPLERETMLREAAAIAKSVKQARSMDSYANHTLVKIGLTRLRSLLGTFETSETEIAEVVKSVQRELTLGLLEFPNDAYLLSADSEFAEILKDQQRVITSLDKAFHANTKAGFLAVRLASIYEKAGKPSEAKIILEQALEANRTDKTLHYRYAKHLMITNAGNNELLTYHLQRSFVSGDSNYDAQLLYARQLYISGDKEGSRAVFHELKRARVGPDTRDALLYPLKGFYRGTITQMEATYVLIRRADNASEQITAQRKNIPDDTWVLLTYGANVRFEIAFNFHGPSADKVQPSDLI